MNITAESSKWPGAGKNADDSAAVRELLAKASSDFGDLRDWLGAAGVPNSSFRRAAAAQLA